MHRADPEALAQREFDLIVIGGGITGVATARDAALRGLSVLLVEKDDFAAGTSSRSTKLIHGGLRYLETYQFKMVAESLQERERMLRLAPHLTEVRPFLYLLYRGYPETRFKLSLGLTFYDAASGQWRKRRHAMLSREQVLEHEPHLNPEGLLGAGRFYDVLTDDARLTLDTAKGAARAGAVLLNHARVTGLLIEAGEARGVRIEDQLGGGVVEVHGRQVLNATGPWTEQTRALEDGGPAGRLRPTKGVHIVLRKRDFPLNTAVFLRSPDDNRVVWPIPSLDDSLVYVGTTDTDYIGDPDSVRPEEADLQYLLNVANHTIPDARLDLSHVVGCWAGLRPLVAPSPGTSTGNTSREHAISVGPAGMLTISGGKLTSSRLMARQFVDAAVERLGRSTRRPAGLSLPGELPGQRAEPRSEQPSRHPGARHPGEPSCRSAEPSRHHGESSRHPGERRDLPTRTHWPRSQTATTPISGAELDRVPGIRVRAAAAGVPAELVTTWIARYGSNAGAVLSRWLAAPEASEVIGPRWLTRAEVRYCVEEEMCRTVEDLMVRRTSLFYWDATGGVSHLDAISAELASLLGWTEDERVAQADAYRALVARHRP